MIIEWILGHTLVTEDELRAAMEKALEHVDRDGNGKISVGEALALIREVLRR